MILMKLSVLLRAFLKHKEARSFTPREFLVDKFIYLRLECLRLF
jgi:hypothetical protein